MYVCDMYDNRDTSNYYESIYVEYAPMLLHFANKFVSSFYSEDIVHDVFIKLWDRQVFLLPKNELKRILYVAVRNACIDHLRRLSLEQDIIDKRAFQLKLDELDFFESSDELFMRKDLMEQLMKKVDELPERCREIFKLSYIQGMKAAEIAKELDLSVRTVENHLYRALLFLRKQNSSLFTYIFLLV